MSDGSRFNDGKEQGALRTIGEVSTAFGIRQHVLRYWELQFPMLRPLKRSGGRRYYRPGDVALLEIIDRLVNREGYTLKGARQAIERGATEGAAEAGIVLPGAVPADDSAVLPQLRSIRNRLASALSA